MEVLVEIQDLDAIVSLCGDNGVCGNGTCDVKIS